MQNGSSSAGRSSTGRPRPAGNANSRMFASIQSTLRSGKDFRPESTAPSRAPRRREHTAMVLKSVDEVIGQLADLERRGEHSTQQIKQNLEASSATLDEMWDEEWARLVEVLMKMCMESDEAVFVVDLLPIFMKYSDFLDIFRERMLAVCSEFVLPEECAGEGQRGLEQVPAFLGSLLCARWPRGMHRDTQESNPLLFTAFEIIRGWLLVVTDATTAEAGAGGERRKKEPMDTMAAALQEGCKIDGDEEEEEEEEDEAAADTVPLPESDDDEEEEEAAATSPELLNRCCRALASLCESQQRSLWLARPELVDDMYKCIKLAITHNREIEGNVKVALLHTYLLMNEWTRSRAVTTKCAATQTAAS